MDRAAGRRRRHPDRRRVRRHPRGRRRQFHRWHCDSGLDISEQDRENIRSAMATAPPSKQADHLRRSRCPRSPPCSCSRWSSCCSSIYSIRLLAERKDRSILFWKSLPVSDTEVVLSKLLTAAVVAPLFVLLVSSVTADPVRLSSGRALHDTCLGDALMAWHGPTWLSCRRRSCWSRARRCSGTCR